MSDNNNNILEIRNLSVSYHTDLEVVYAVNDVSLTLEKGKTLGLLGETGAGKTTIARSIMHLLPERTARITSGTILVNGENIYEKTPQELTAIRGSKMAMIFQDPMSSLNPVTSIGEQIYEALEYHNYDRLSSKELHKKVDNILSMVGIMPERKHEFPHQFSGGMKQRALIAIALSCEPELLIADEPTTALDVTIQAQVLSLMRDLKEKHGTSMIMISHDLGVIALMCDYVAVVYAGEVVEYGTLEDIFNEALFHHPYTIGLFGSIPRLHGNEKRLKPIEGSMPDPTKQIEGCRFEPRCKFATDECRNRHPVFAQTTTHKVLCHMAHENK